MSELKDGSKSFYESLDTPDRTRWFRAAYVSQQLREDKKGEYKPWQVMSTTDWLTASSQHNTDFKIVLRDLYERTTQVLHPLDNPTSPEVLAMTANEGLSTHNQIMENLVRIYWQDPKFRAIFPVGTTVYYLQILCGAHDFGRTCGLNGGMKLDRADDVSKMLLSRLAPNLPVKEHLHDIDYITGATEPPDINHNFVPWFFKLIDTFGKVPLRDPANFFEPGGGYDSWLEEAVDKGQIPFTTKNDELITPELYKARDMGMSLTAYKKVNELFDINFDDALKQAIARLDA